MLVMLEQYGRMKFLQGRRATPEHVDLEAFHVELAEVYRRQPDAGDVVVQRIDAHLLADEAGFAHLVDIVVAKKSADAAAEHALLDLQHLHLARFVTESKIVDGDVSCAVQRDVSPQPGADVPHW